MRSEAGVTAIILCYHKVGPASSEGRWLNVEPWRLRAHVRLFGRRGYTFVRGGDLLGAWPDRCVCFTFDDAYASALSNAVPILEEFGGIGTFYAVASKVGQDSAWDGERSRPLASWNELRQAQRRGHEIGNHTLDHVRLAEVPFEEQKRQISEADRMIRQEGIQPKSFCYPYGSLSDHSALGDYRIGLGLEKRVACRSDDLRRLPRIIPSFSDSLALLLYKIYIRPKLP